MGSNQYGFGAKTGYKTRKHWNLLFPCRSLVRMQSQLPVTIQPALTHISFAFLLKPLFSTCPGVCELCLLRYRAIQALIFRVPEDQLSMVSKRVKNLAWFTSTAAFECLTPAQYAHRRRGLKRILISISAQMRNYTATIGTLRALGISENGKSIVSKKGRRESKKSKWWNTHHKPTKTAPVLRVGFANPPNLRKKQ